MWIKFKKTQLLNSNLVVHFFVQERKKHQFNEVISDFRACATTVAPPTASCYSEGVPLWTVHTPMEGIDLSGPCKSAEEAQKYIDKISESLFLGRNHLYLKVDN